MRKIPGPPPDHRDTFIGQTVALDALAADLEVGGILTLIGPPGAGKSRWAAEVIRHRLPERPDGPWWVDLTAATATALAERVALAVGAPTAPGAPAEATVLRHLGGAQGVLVLDGCDGVRRETGQLADLVRRRCPGVRLLVTCRTALVVTGERVRSVACDDPADTGCDDSVTPWRLDDAVAMLRALVGAAPQGSVDEQTGHRLCRVVAGLPLAVELVAARAVRMSPAEILAQLVGVDGGSRELTEVIQWSYGLLSRTDRRVLARLAVFSGGFSVADAEAVAGADQLPGAVTLALGRLAEAALVRHQVQGHGEQAHSEQPPIGRFVMPAPIRRFAAAALARMGELAQVRDRHASHWARLATAAESILQSRQQQTWMVRLELDRDNMLAALRWLAEGADVEPALRMAGALGRFWWLGGRFDEGWRALRSVLARPGAGRRTVGRAAALHALGLATFWHETDAVRARRSGACFEEAAQIYRELGERSRLVWALRDLGSHHNGAGDLDRARDLFGQSMDLAREIGDVAAVGVAACYLGIAASYAGDRTEARQRLEEAVVLLSGRGGADELVRAQFYLACLECDDRNPSAARARFKAMVEGNDAVPMVSYVVGFALDGLARLAAAEDRCADALRLSGAAAPHTPAGVRRGAGRTRSTSPAGWPRPGGWWGPTPLTGTSPRAAVGPWNRR